MPFIIFYCCSGGHVLCCATKLLQKVVWYRGAKRREGKKKVFLWGLCHLSMTGEYMWQQLFLCLLEIKSYCTMQVLHFWVALVVLWFPFLEVVDRGPTL